MEIQSVEAAELTRNILIDWIPIFEDKQVEYDIDIPEQPVRVRLDMDSYMRIVNNLIQNVIAHSHADKIKIALSKKENNMELLLADNGVGIEKEDLKHIFERLYKCDKGRSEKGMEVHGLTYKLLVAVELGIFITAGTLPIIVLVVFFSKTYIFSILLCVFYSVVSLTVETLFGTLPKWLCWLMPIPLTTLWGAGDMVKHGFPLNVNALEAIIPSTFQTVIILGIMAVASISLIDFLYKKRGE